MVYYLSSGRNYNFSDMSLDGLKKQKVGPMPAHLFVYGIPVAIAVLFMIIGFSVKPSLMSDVDPADASKRVVSFPKVIFYSAGFGTAALLFTYMSAHKMKDQSL
jgi:hypothetical protein